MFAVDGYRLAVMPLSVQETAARAKAKTEAAAEGEAQAEAAAEAATSARAEAETADSGEAEGDTEVEARPKRRRKAREPVAIEA